MSELKIIPLGVGDTFSEHNTTASILIELDGFRLGVDCPDSYRRVLTQASKPQNLALDINTIDHMLITHVHGDHMNGLEGFAFWKYFVEKKKTHLYTSPEARADIWDRRLSAPMDRLFDGREFKQMRFEDYFDYRALSWTEPVALGPLRVRTYRTIHHVPTTALLIEWTTGRKTRKLGYSADTAFDPKLIDFFADADLIIHETNYGPAHTPYESLSSLPADVRARMRLIHYPDTLDLSAPSIVPLRTGEIVSVP
jgi:ribonuclease BN (tRNA processing enzyme)